MSLLSKYVFFPPLGPRQKFVSTRKFDNSGDSDEKKTYISKLADIIHSRNAPLQTVSKSKVYIFHLKNEPVL